MPSKPSFKKALITGSKSGLGKALADFLKQKGITVLRLGSSDANLSIPEQRKKIHNLIEKEKPDLVVNNAGLGFYGPCLAHPIDDMMKVLEVNAAAVVEITLHAAKVMKENQIEGTILQISSAASFFPFPSFSIYAASKRLVNDFSAGLREELKSHKIDILVACPGQIATSFRHRAAKGKPQKPDHRTMTKEKAVSYLWKQLERKKKLFVFGWKTKCLIWLAKCLPQILLYRILQKSVKDRI